MKKKKGIPKVYIMIVLVVAIYTGYNISNAIAEKHEKNIRVAEYNKEIKTLKSDITKLKKEKESAKSLDFIEKVAREDLGMVKPREIVYIDKDKADQK